MQIYIDGLFYKGSGIGRYYESLTKELAKKDIKIFTCIPEKYKSAFIKDFNNFNKNIEPIFVNYEKFSTKGMIYQSKILKNLENKVDIFFFPHINLPFYIPKKTVVTIHDLRPFTKYWDRGIIKKFTLSFLLKRALKNSTKIITISKTVEQTLKDIFNIESEKIKVIYRFIDDKFLKADSNPKPIINEPYILFVGNRKKHKNLSGLIKAFSFIKEKIGHKLVIAGAKEKKMDEIDILKGKLNIENRIIEFISPSDETIINLYQNADLFVFPSFFEGFGLPPLEAIACGCPAISSNIPVLREILGEEIACFNPYDIKDIAAKILQGIKNRKSLLEIGKSRLNRFDKEQIVKEHINLFLNIIKESK